MLCTDNLTKRDLRPSKSKRTVPLYYLNIYTQKKWIANNDLTNILVMSKDDAKLVFKSMFKIFLSCKSRDYGSDNKIINAFSLPDNYIIGGQVN